MSVEPDILHENFLAWLSTKHSWQAKGDITRLEAAYRAGFREAAGLDLLQVKTRSERLARALQAIIGILEPIERRHHKSSRLAEIARHALK